MPAVVGRKSNATSTSRGSAHDEPKRPPDVADDAPQRAARTRPGPPDCSHIRLLEVDPVAGVGDAPHASTDAHANTTSPACCHLRGSAAPIA